MCVSWGGVWLGGSIFYLDLSWAWVFITALCVCFLAATWGLSVIMWQQSAKVFLCHETLPDKVLLTTDLVEQNGSHSLWLFSLPSHIFSPSLLRFPAFTFPLSISLFFLNSQVKTSALCGWREKCHIETIYNISLVLQHLYCFCFFSRFELLLEKKINVLHE